ncbi:hypothetical protein LSH36_2595g00005 [Paralvinella palmiformis]|uniref:Uncharacterized protein n=1 Tax=Paralvinella palmiformis TaxID=53620 RepID=A0AAD9IPM2_9ANNE|nr:hypothetical protein LSH36_2595g00005 [Paralvinella palmiformis]
MLNGYRRRIFTQTGIEASLVVLARDLQSGEYFRQTRKWQKDIR